MAYTTIDKHTAHFNTITYTGNEYKSNYWSWVSTRYTLD